MNHSEHNQFQGLAQSWRDLALSARTQAEDPELTENIRIIFKEQARRCSQCAEQLESMLAEMGGGWHSMNEPPSNGQTALVSKGEDVLMAFYDRGTWTLWLDDTYILTNLDGWQPLPEPMRKNSLQE